MKTIDFADGNFEILAKIKKALEPLRKTERLLNSIPESVLRQAAYMDRISRIFTPAAITAQIEQYERMRPQIEAVVRLQSSPAFESAYRHLEAVNQSMVFDSAEALLKSSKMLEAYEMRLWWHRWRMSLTIFPRLIRLCLNWQRNLTLPTWTFPMTAISSVAASGIRLRIWQPRSQLK